jgi:hypothetical protein
MCDLSYLLCRKTFEFIKVIVTSPANELQLLLVKLGPVHLQMMGRCRLKQCVEKKA